MNAAKLARQLDALTAKLDELIAAHNAQDDAIRTLKLRLTFAMEKIVVRKRRDPGALIVGNEPETRELTLAQCWLEDGATYIALVEAQSRALTTAILKAEAGRRAVHESVTDELRVRSRERRTGVDVTQPETGRESDSTV